MRKLNEECGAVRAGTEVQRPPRLGSQLGMESRLGGESEDAQGFTAEKADGVMSDLRGQGQGS